MNKIRIVVACKSLKIQDAIRDLSVNDKFEILDFIEDETNVIETIKYIDKKHKVLLFSVVSDKDYTEMIRQLCSYKWIDEYIITGINNKRRLDIDLMKQAFYENGSMVTVIEDIKSALNYAIKQKKALDGALICSGSLYLVGEIKKEINLLTT